jgi:HlyD family secretion protein
MKKRRIDWLWIVLAMAAAGGLVFALWPQAIDVDLAEVTRGPMLVTVNEDGKTRVRERYIVAAPLAGQMARIALDEGDSVDTGKTLLATIEPADPALLDARARSEAEARVKAAEAARDQAAADVEKAKEAHELARHTYERVAGLKRSGAVSQEDFDRAEHEERLRAQAVRSAEFALRVAEYELEVARAALIRVQPENGASGREGLRLLAPVDGRVLRVHQESATVVAPGMPLIELGDPEDMEIVIDVLSSDAARIKPGDRVILEHWGGAKPLEARVRVVEPSGFTKVSSLGIEEQRVNVIADFTGPPDERAALGDEFRVEARIVVWESAAAVQVPLGALFRQGEEWATYVVDAGRAKFVTPKIGRNNGLVAEVLSGLAPGTRVILHPGDKVADGVRVAARR